jgi:hypothetical protein
MAVGDTHTIVHIVDCRIFSVSIPENKNDDRKFMPLNHDP